MRRLLNFFVGAGTLAVFLLVFVALAIWSRSNDISRIAAAFESVPADKIVPVAKSENVFRVATQNCQNYSIEFRRVAGASMFWPKPKSERAALARSLARVNADLVALQEIGDEKQLRLLKNDLKKLGCLYDYACVLDGRDSVRRLAFLSKVPFARILRFPEEEEMSRGVLAVETEVAGTRLLVFNLHLKSRLTRTREDPEAALEREGELLRALEILRETIAGTPNYLLLGDFNDAPESETIGLLRASQLFCEIPAADGNGKKWTFENAAKNLEDTSDYIFPSPSLAKRLAGDKIFINDASVLSGSDHRSLWLDLDFSQQASSRRNSSQATASATSIPRGDNASVPAGTTSSR